MDNYSMSANFKICTFGKSIYRKSKSMKMRKRKRKHRDMNNTQSATGNMAINGNIISGMTGEKECFIGE